ncbi:CHRD domain-containing protein [Candidatus Nitrotoga arctica]|uniref:CHRD domain-containing protein n=1 Tax=Candidatus Nitrotoga arctica TaxID=453162 RepID=A0ABM8YZP3_9PROT|nr:CHRD domain-containing protein [Candidatus Nitrotoga arctica]CAG9933067.1 CHRD domain-containing protein [Candidatus Nitrotoga arctica]
MEVNHEYIICNKKRSLIITSLIASIYIGGMNLALATGVNVILSGEEEVPPVTTSAIGESNIKVESDTSISGAISTTGIDGTTAHIHEAPVGKNGPVIVTLKKVSDKIWEIPSGTRLTQGQFANFKAGNLYLNVHSAVHKSGEIRGQITENKLSHNFKK